MSSQNPPRRSLFAVWRWKWWVWAAVVVLMPLSYFLSAPPVYVLTEMSTPDAVEMYYQPAVFIANRSQIVADIYRWEFRLISETEGDGVLFFFWQ